MEHFALYSIVNAIRHGHFRRQEARREHGQSAVCPEMIPPIPGARMWFVPTVLCCCLQHVWDIGICCSTRGRGRGRVLHEDLVITESYRSQASKRRQWSHCAACTAAQLSGGVGPYEGRGMASAGQRAGIKVNVMTIW
jgi:hypothetical protein